MYLCQKNTTGQLDSVNGPLSHGAFLPSLRLCTLPAHLPQFQVTATLIIQHLRHRAAVQTSHAQAATLAARPGLPPAWRLRGLRRSTARPFRPSTIDALAAPAGRACSTIACML